MIYQEEFYKKHIGPNEAETKEMLATVGVKSLDELMDKTIPSVIRLQKELNLPEAISEYEYLQHIRKIATKNKIFKTYIGQGYYGTITPSVILRNVFENPGWYTQYTPYQAEISQGRLESLLNFQTMVADLTALPIANASLLDEGTSAAEAMLMLYHQAHRQKKKFFVDEQIFPQTIDVLITRSTSAGIELVFGNYQQAKLDATYFGAIVQYPNNTGSIENYKEFIETAHTAGVPVIMIADILALTLLTPPGELGADVAVGSTQRLGVPMGFGGPHAAYFATKDEFKRNMPGRLIGVSIDAQGNRALRMALQTREQHIKREKATSNICTAQALLANMAAMYAVYHGASGLKGIASRIALFTQTLNDALSELGFENLNKFYFDTLLMKADVNKIKSIAEAREINFRYFDENHIGISLDETTSQKDVLDIVYVFAESIGKNTAGISFHSDDELACIQPSAVRTSSYLTHPVFNTYHSESQMMRYIKSLENKDLSLNTSMITLGSCTMKLTAATEMIPVSFPEFANIHPFAPSFQTKGYQIIIDELSKYLCEITGFAACSLQPNSGANGEYSGLTTIMRYHRANNQANRNVVLIPVSAHGTNPASAIMAGMRVVVIKSNEDGTVDVADLKAKAEQYKNELGALMITYPSTSGVFEETIKEMVKIIHDNGGQVYMDGANMNAQVGFTSPAFIGADICHLNLHKTFGIPHGGGGPGVGPICCAKHLVKYLPGHCMNYESSIVSSSSHHSPFIPYGAVVSAPYGSANVLLISYAYIKMLGTEGLKKCTQYAILNANYMKARLAEHFKILYTGINGFCAHEFIVDLHEFKVSVNIEAEDIAKRLMDYSFHAPTMGFPVHDTIMIEPTESEDKGELDRLCDALISIYGEIKAIEEGKADKTDNVLKNSPHTQLMIAAGNWQHPYTRMQAAFPVDYTLQNKFWSSVARIDNAHGDRNLICTCEPVESYI